MSRLKYLQPNWHSVSYDSFAWKLVPIEPTDHMLDLGACFEDPSDYYGPLMDEGDLSRDVYRAMLEGAPEPPKGLSDAAPELLEALREAVLALDGLAKGEGVFKPIEQTIVLARAAIAKAEGRQ